MDLIQALFLAVGFPAITTLAIIGLLRAGGPIFARLFGNLLKTRGEMKAELDADRDRVIANLRLELDDWKRRLAEANTRASSAENEAAQARAEVARLNTFIDTLLARLGTTRAAVESGDPWGR